MEAGLLKTGSLEQGSHGAGTQIFKKEVLLVAPGAIEVHRETSAELGLRPLRRRRLACIDTSEGYSKAGTGCAEKTKRKRKKLKTGTNHCCLSREPLLRRP